MKKFIDATVFMGMHSLDEDIRVACKNFFVRHLEKTLFMSLENVGKCDDIVWKVPHKVQDEYYPFMDRLHTLMDIQRLPYDQETLERMDIRPELSTFQQLTLSLSSSGVLYTFDNDLLGLELNFVASPEKNKKEALFPVDLEKYYQKSRVFHFFV
jgi:hypothetical protein